MIGSSLMEHSVIQELVRNGDSEPGGWDLIPSGSRTVSAGPVLVRVGGPAGRAYVGRHGPALHRAEVRCSGAGVGRRKPAGGMGHLMTCPVQLMLTD